MKSDSELYPYIKRKPHQGERIYLFLWLSGLLSSSDVSYWNNSPSTLREMVLSSKISCSTWPQTGLTGKLRPTAFHRRGHSRRYLILALASVSACIYPSSARTATRLIRDPNRLENFKRPTAVDEEAEERLILRWFRPARRALQSRNSCFFSELSVEYLSSTERTAKCAILNRRRALFPSTRILFSPSVERHKWNVTNCFMHTQKKWSLFSLVNIFFYYYYIQQIFDLVWRKKEMFRIKHPSESKGK